MANAKPVTYPQQIQNLKGELEQRDEEIQSLREKLGLVTGLQEQVTSLQAQLASTNKDEHQSVAATKARETDLIQRAEQAEVGVRNLQTENKALRTSIGQLESQLELLGKERDKVTQLQRKNEMLSEQLNLQNTHLAQIQQSKRDAIFEKDAQLESQSNELRRLRMQVAANERALVEIVSVLKNAPDVLAQLRQVAGLG